MNQLSDESELEMSDRWDLDDAVLQLLGVRTKKERTQILNELYAYLRRFFEWTRQKEEKAIVNKQLARRRSRVTPTEIATQIFEEIYANEASWLRKYDPDFIDKKKPFDTYDLPDEGKPVAVLDVFNGHGVRFSKGKKDKETGFVETKNPAQDALIVVVAMSGVRGLVRIPRAEEECKRLMQQYGSFVESREQRVCEMIELRTADEELQERVYNLLLAMICHQ